MKTINAAFSARVATLALCRKLVSTLPIALVGAWCPDEALAFTAYWHYSWLTAANSHTTLATNTEPLGSADRRTCFLSGVTGLLGSTAAPAGTSLLWQGVAVEVGPLNHFRLSVCSGTGGRVGAHARCVNSIEGRTGEVFWSPGMGAQPLGTSTNPNRRCFLTSIRVEHRIVVMPAFSHAADYVRVWKDDTEGKWYIGGFIKKWKSGNEMKAGNVVATARCIAVTRDLGSWQWIAGEIGSRTDALADSTGAVQCFLTGIAGKFTYNNWSDGAYITHEPDANKFMMDTSNGKSGRATCVKWLAGAAPPLPSIAQPISAEFSKLGPSRPRSMRAVRYSRSG